MFNNITLQDLQTKQAGEFSCPWSSIQIEKFCWLIDSNWGRRKSHFWNLTLHLFLSRHVSSLWYLHEKLSSQVKPLLIRLGYWGPAEDARLDSESLLHYVPLPANILSINFTIVLVHVYAYNLPGSCTVRKILLPDNGVSCRVILVLARITFPFFFVYIVSSSAILILLFYLWSLLSDGFTSHRWRSH